MDPSQPPGHVFVSSLLLAKTTVTPAVPIAPSRQCYSLLPASLVAVPSRTFPARAQVLASCDSFAILWRENPSNCVFIFDLILINYFLFLATRLPKFHLATPHEPRTLSLTGTATSDRALIPDTHCRFTPEHRARPPFFVFVVLGLDVSSFPPTVVSPTDPLQSRASTSSTLAWPLTLDV